MKEGKLRSNVNWPEVLQEDGIKQGLSVLLFSNPQAHLHYGIQPTLRFTFKWVTVPAVTLCCIPIS